MTPAAVVALRMIEALGLSGDPERARAVLAHAVARQLPRLSVADVRDVLGAVTPAAGGDLYERDPQPGGDVPHQRGVRLGGVVDGGELVDETELSTQHQPKGDITDIIVTSGDLEAEGTLTDPEIYGEYAAYRGMPVNRWTVEVRNLLATIPVTGTLASVLQLIITDHEHADNADLAPFAFQYPGAGAIWLEPNGVDGWTALLPDEH
jgi:hypothetical protein